MKNNKPENQTAQTLENQEDELNDNELDYINGGLSGTSMKGKEPKPVVIAIIAILIG